MGIFVSISFILYLLAFIFLLVKDGSSKRPFQEKMLFSFGLLFLIFVWSYKLVETPHNTLSDAARDFSLINRKIVDGEYFYPWANGVTGAFTYLSVLIGYPFEYFYPRSPAALQYYGLSIAIFTYLIFYIFSKKILGKGWGLAAALIISLAPLNIFFLRTYGIFVFNLMIPVVAVTWLYEKKSEPWDKITALRRGLILGILTNFHMALPIAFFDICLVLFSFDLVNFLRSRMFLKFLISIAFMGLGIFIAILPRWDGMFDWCSSSLSFISSARVLSIKEIIQLTFETILTFFKPNELSGILGPPFGVSLIGSQIFLWLGFFLFVYTSIFVKKSELANLAKCFLCIVLIAITHGALSNISFLTYRLAVIIPLLVISACIGFYRLSVIVNINYGKRGGKCFSMALITILVLLSARAGYHFEKDLHEFDSYKGFPADRFRITSEISQLFKGGVLKGQEVCFVSRNEEVVNDLQYPHQKEHLSYYTAVMSYKQKIITEGSQYTLYVGKDCWPFEEGTKINYWGWELIFDKELSAYLDR